MSDEVQMIPVNAWFKGDHITHLVVFESTMTDPAGHRVDHRPGDRQAHLQARGCRVQDVLRGHPVPNDITVGESIIQPLGEVTVEFAN